MKWLLNITLAVELIVAICWTIAMWTETGSGGIAVLGWFAIVVVIYGVAFLTGALVAWRRPLLRRRALLVMALPFVGGFAPWLLRTLSGGPVGIDTVWRLVVITAGGLGVLALLRPRRTAGLMPGVVFRSRRLNLAVVGALALAWCPLLIGVVWSLTGAGQDAIRQADRSSSGMAAAYLVLAMSAYVMLLGAGSVLAGAWGWLGITGGVEGARRRLHFVQLIGAVPGILLAISTWSWLMSQR